jgi:hypothetical protein
MVGLQFDARKDKTSQLLAINQKNVFAIKKKNVWAKTIHFHNVTVLAK